MERKKRIITFITFLICTSCLALLTASLTTHKWIIVKPVRLTFINGSIIELNQHHNNLRRSKQVSEEDVSRQDSLLGLDRSFSVESKYNSSSDFTGSGNQVDETDSRKFRGTIYFGLFQGTKILNYGFGDRVSYLSIKDELLRNPNLMPFGLWLFTVLCVAIAIIFGIVASIFAIINTVMTPIEVITGLHGLFLWNGMGALFCTGACVSWIVQFRTKLRKNVLTPEELEDGWSSESRAKLGYSFFLVVVTLGLFLFNIFLVSLASRKPATKYWDSSKQRISHRSIGDKNPEGVIMLY